MWINVMPLRGSIASVDLSRALSAHMDSAVAMALRRGAGQAKAIWVTAPNQRYSVLAHGSPGVVEALSAVYVPVWPCQQTVPICFGPGVGNGLPAEKHGALLSSNGTRDGTLWYGQISHG
jgi:hypothetical protein